MRVKYKGSSSLSFRGFVMFGKRYFLHTVPLLLFASTVVSAATQAPQPTPEQVQKETQRLQNILKNTKEGAVADLSGQGVINNGLVYDGTAIVTGNGVHKGIRFSHQVTSKTIDLLTVRPPDDDDIDELDEINHLFLWAN